MPKALSSICLVLLICFGGSAWAGKPKIAVLGLEVAPGPNGAVDPDTTQVARDLTKELRSRAQSGASPYVIAPNSNKELTDEKLLMSCDNEAMSCMVVIGAGLLSDVLLYGRIERKGDTYRVSLKLLDVKAKTIQQANGEVPVGGSITGVAKKLFGKLTGDTSSITGTLVVKAKAKAGAAIDNGAVMVDEDRKGKLAGGKLTVTGLTEGRHTVAIEAGGYRRFEETVTIHGDEQENLNAVMIEKEAPPPSPSSNLVWKVSLGASIGVLAGGAGFAAYSYFFQVTKKFNDAAVGVIGEPGATIGSDDCGKSKQAIIDTHTPKVTSFNYSVLQNACMWKTRTYIGYGIGAVGLVGAVASLIMLTRDSEPSEKSPTAARGKQPDVAIVPVLTPDGGGASLTVRW